MVFDFNCSLAFYFVVRSIIFFSINAFLIIFEMKMKKKIK